MIGFIINIFRSEELDHSGRPAIVIFNEKDYIIAAIGTSRAPKHDYIKSVSIELEKGKITYFYDIKKVNEKAINNWWITNQKINESQKINLISLLSNSQIEKIWNKLPNQYKDVKTSKSLLINAPTNSQIVEHIQSEIQSTSSHHKEEDSIKCEIQSTSSHHKEEDSLNWSTCYLEVYNSKNDKISENENWILNWRSNDDCSHVTKNSDNDLKESEVSLTSHHHSLNTFQENY